MAVLTSKLSHLLQCTNPSIIVWLHDQGASILIWTAHCQVEVPEMAGFFSESVTLPPQKKQPLIVDCKVCLLERLITEKSGAKMALPRKFSGKRSLLWELEPFSFNHGVDNVPKMEKNCLWPKRYHLPKWLCFPEKVWKWLVLSKWSHNQPFLW